MNEHSPSLSLAHRVDQICNEFEAAWKAGQRPNLDQFLARVEEHERAELLGELRPIDSFHRQRLGELAGRAEHNLLQGVLALQMAFISGEQLTAAMRAWVLAKSRTLDEILREQHALQEDTRTLLVALVEKHLALHGGEPERSLAALQFLGETHEVLLTLGDGEIAAALSFVTARGATNGSGSTGAKSGAATPRFRVLRPHAKGGLGEVSVAHDGELNREVALKEIQPKFREDSHSQSRFLLEAEITGGLEHPGIVPVYSLGKSDDGRPYYAMRFIRGDSLKEAIERFHQRPPRNSDLSETVSFAPSGSQPFVGHSSLEAPTRGGADYSSLEFRQLLGRFVDVCQAIEYAHSRGVLHRDLKPGNIMLGKYGETLVVDWGLAKVAGKSDRFATSEELSLVPSSGSNVEQTRSGAALGTPAYMSPEQAAGRLDQLGPATDIYSLGATLYHVLTGRPPLVDSPLRELLARAERGDFPRPRQINPQIPQALEAVCLRAMARHQPDRYTAALDIADEIERYLADEPVLAHVEPVRVRARRWVKRHQTVVGSTLAAVLVAMVTLSVLTMTVTGKNRQLAAANTQISQQSDQIRTQNESLRETNVQLTAAKTDAETKRAEADASAQVAREQSRLALKTLQSVIYEFQGAFRDVAGGAEVRQRLLATALEKLEGVSTKFVEQSRVDRDTGAALLNLGTAVLDLGSDGHASRLRIKGLEQTESEPITPTSRSAALTAERLFRRAHEIASQMAKDDPDNLQLQEDLSDVHSNLGLTYERLGRTADALVHYEEALRICRNVVTAAPQKVRWLRDLSSSHLRLGQLFLTIGRTTDALTQFEAKRKIDLALVDADPMQEKRVNLSTSYANIGEVYMKLGRTADAIEQFEEAVRLQRLVVESNPHNAQSQREFCDILYYLGEAYMQVGRTAEAEPLFEEYQSRSRSLVAADPHDAQNQSALALSCIALGDVYGQLSRLSDSLTQYSEGLKIVRTLAETDPQNARTQRDIYVLLQRVGATYQQLGRTADALTHFEEFQTRCRALAESDPSDTRKQADLSVSHDRIGHIYLQLGRPDDALVQFQAQQKVDRKLVETDPNNVLNWQHRARSCNNLGRVLLKLRREQEAITNLFEGLRICRQLTDADPHNHERQEFLASSYNELGKALLQTGRTADALVQFEAAQKIVLALIAADPERVGLRRILSETHETLGDVYLKLGRSRDALAQCEAKKKLDVALAETDPSRVSYQRNLAVSHGKLGSMYLLFGRTADALAQFEAKMRIDRSLVDADPKNNDRQFHLSISHGLIGDVYERQGQATESLTHYTEGLRILRAVVEANPSDTNLQRNLGVSMERVGSAYLRLGRTEDALAVFKDLQTHCRTLADAHPRDAQRQYDLCIAMDRLGDLYLRLGRANDALPQFEARQKIAAALFSAEPDRDDNRRNLAIGYSKLGDVFLKLGRTTDALEQFEQLLVRCRESSAPEPHNTQKLGDYAMSLERLGSTYLQLGRVTDAQTQFEAFHARCRELVAADPKSAEFQRLLVISHFKLGEIDISKERFDEAVARFQDGMAVADQMIENRQLIAGAKYLRATLQGRIQYCGSARIAAGDWETLLKADAKSLPQLLALRAKLGLTRGDVASAVQSADKLCELNPREKVEQFNAACIYANCAEFVTRDKPAPTESEQAKRKSFLDLAVATLKDSVAAGWDDFDRLRKVDDLKPLHGLPEFEALFPQPKDSPSP